ATCPGPAAGLLRSATVKIVTHGYRTRNPPSLQIAHGTITSRSQVVPRLGPNGTRRCSYARPFSCRRREGAMLNLVHLARTPAALSRDLGAPCWGASVVTRRPWSGRATSKRGR